MDVVVLFVVGMFGALALLAFLSTRRIARKRTDGGGDGSPGAYAHGGRDRDHDDGASDGGDGGGD